MSEYESEFHNISLRRRSGGDEQAQNTNSNTSNDTLDETTTVGSADNSIIGKVKSRVSSIIPSSLSKWFSPLSKNNDSLNGSVGSTNSRRRRRIELDEDEEEDSDGEGAQTHGGDVINRSLLDQGDPEDEDSDDDSNNSDEDTPYPVVSVRNPRSNVRLPELVRQPPPKRSRFSLDITNMQNSPLMQHRPLVSSTPAVEMSNARSSVLGDQRGNCNIGRFEYIAEQRAEESGYNFSGAPSERIWGEVAGEEGATKADNALKGIGISTRRSLNLPPSTSQSAATEHLNAAGILNLKRQSLATVKNSMSRMQSIGELSHERYRLDSGALASAAPTRTSTTIVEIDSGDVDDEDVGHVNIRGMRRPFLDETLEREGETTITGPGTGTGAGGGATTTRLNGKPGTFVSKRQKLINGRDDNYRELSSDPNAVSNMERDSASESSEGGGSHRAAEHTRSTLQRRTGLFNMSSGSRGQNTSNSRTSSFGNGLNFYSHLEGRKSLFGSGAQGAAGNNPLNTSTLSLTSLNRRQFNASIYGSTSALSDSRLLNTFSPFYKGKTTYGGAAAYNKYPATGQGTGAGASGVRIAPTLIRPTSSLSTLSSSNNSLATAGVGVNTGIASSDNPSAISSTAKRILDLINDFATPLSDAKKMASNLKINQQKMLPHGRTARLTDADVQASRSMRLSQVRTPYMRPIVTLQPTTTAASAEMDGKAAYLPPIRELQVPSMSQLLQMKKMQNLTEQARQIGAENNHNTMLQSNISAEYRLPVPDDNNKRDEKQQQQKHTNKMKNKMSSSARITGSKDINLMDDAPPTPANLPNIAFPLMQSVPKFDIVVPKATQSSSPGKASVSSPQELSKANTGPATLSGSVAASPRKPLNNFAFNIKSSTTENAATSSSLTSSERTNFKFAAPVEIEDVHAPHKNIMPINNNFKFSQPIIVDLQTANTHNDSPQKKIQPEVPQLKSGSVLDVLQKPFVLPATSTPSAAASASAPATATAKTASSATTSVGEPAATNTFGNQFKMSSKEWECPTCMIRNKLEASSCVACETARPSSNSGDDNKKSGSSKRASPPKSTATTKATVPLGGFTGFGSEFKKSSGEWECDVCMIRNKNDVKKCVACENPQKTAKTGSSGSSAAAPTTLPPIKNSFGDAFKPKANTWNCPTCLIVNKNESVECVACNTKQPGSRSSSSGAPIAPITSAPTTKFKFGIPPATASSSSNSGDFKSLAAAQKASKWECETCMTRNDDTRLKCICCEQAKPGSQTQPASDNVPKFSFGSTAAAKFSFGFGATKEQTASASASALSTETKTPASASAATSTTKTDTGAKGGFVFGISSGSKPTAASADAPTGSGFSFGIKPLGESSKTTTGQDVVDITKNSSKQQTSMGSFQFGVNANAKGPEATKGFVFGTTATATATTAATSTTATAATLQSSVKFALPTSTTKPNSTATITTTGTGTGTNDAKKVETGATGAAPIFGFGSPAAPASTLKSEGGFSFGVSPKTGSDAVKAQTGITSSISTTTGPTPAVAGFSFKPTTTTPSNTKMFSFGSPSPSSTTSTSTSASGSTTSAATSTTVTNTQKATVKPMFSFGNTNAATTSATSSSFTSTTANANATGSGGFSFGTAGASSNSPKAAKSIFGQAAGSETSTSTNTTTAMPLPAMSANVFGSFGKSAMAPPPMFGSTSKMSSSASMPTSAPTLIAAVAGAGAVASSTTSTSTTFGSFSAPTSTSTSTAASTSTSTAMPMSSANIFGSFGNANASGSGDTKPMASATPIFGNVAASSSNTAGAAAPTSTPISTSGTAAAPFIFGSSASLAGGNTDGGATSTASSSTPAWPKNNFVFGNPTAPSVPSAVPDAPKSVFGSFGNAAPPTATPSIFGNIGNNAPTGSAATPVVAFGSVPATGAATNLFGSNTSTAAAAPANTNLFGSSSVAPNPSAPATAFGSSNFESAGSLAPNVAAFGSGSTFGGFGAASSSTDGASAAKKSEPAFNFGAATGASTTQPTAGAFNFGASASVAKPAFNFTASNPPAFNFTGTANTDATPNAPFQFNAGVTPASNNIFAPTPTPGAQSAQQARRKIRAPIRRLTPR